MGCNQVCLTGLFSSRSSTREASASSACVALGYSIFCDDCRIHASCFFFKVRKGREILGQAG